MGAQHQNHTVTAGARLGTAVLALAGAWTVGLAATATPASAATLGATATIAAPGTTTALTGSQGSATLFTVELPFEAACSGDTASDGYHEFSYLVPSSTAVSSLNFGSGFASNDLGLVDQNGNPWDDIDTDPTSGQVIGIANNYEWGPLVSGGDIKLTGSGGLLYSGSTGVWNAGIACATSAGVLSDYWVTQVTFTASKSDSNGFVWSAVPGVPSSGVPGAPTSPVAVQGKKSIAVTWTDPASNGGSPITGYDVYCSTTDPPTPSGTPSATASGATATSATVTGTKKSTTYFCVVTAVNANGPSAASPVAGKPLDTTKTTVACKPKKVATSKTATCTAKVKDATTATAKATGTVSWSGAIGSFGTGGTCTLSAGSCSVTFVPSATGTQTITGSYSGSSTQAASSGSGKLKVT